MNIGTNIPDMDINRSFKKDIKISKIEGSLDRPELKGVKTNLKAKINKPDLNINPGNLNIEGEIPEINKQK